MVHRNGYDPGTPCWVDLGTADVAGSTAFYTKLFGWTADSVTDDAGNHIYTMLSKDGRYVAGLGGQPPGTEGMPPLWSTYICVADAAEACQLIEKAGGQVLMPTMQVFDSGHMAVAIDPTGAAFRLWQPLEHKGAGVVNEPDTYAWNELTSSDPERAKQFYAEVFGWTYEVMPMGGHGYAVVQGGDSGGLAGIMGRPEELPAHVPDSWSVYFQVADIAAKFAAVQEQGGQVCFGPQTIPGMGLTIGGLMHPTGGMFCLMQPPG
jgi:hypothetical protein